MLARVRVLPTGDSPEDIMRTLRNAEDGTSGVNPAGDGHWKHRDRVMAYLYRILDENPDIQGIAGYSEGACMAASFLLDEAQRQRLEGRPRQLKCALFITGWPPISPDEEPVLSDEEGALSIDIPTVHVIGVNGGCPVACFPGFPHCTKLRGYMRSMLTACRPIQVRIASTVQRVR